MASRGPCFRFLNLAHRLHLPVGYHGRASSVVISGVDFKRPCGQLQAHPEDAAQGSVYGPSRQLDFELELVRHIGGRRGHTLAGRRMR